MHGRSLNRCSPPWIHMVDSNRTNRFAACGAYLKIRQKLSARVVAVKTKSQTRRDSLNINANLIRTVHWILFLRIKKSNSSVIRRYVFFIIQYSVYELLKCFINLFVSNPKAKTILITEPHPDELYKALIDLHLYQKLSFYSPRRSFGLKIRFESSRFQIMRPDSFQL